MVNKRIFSFKFLRPIIPLSILLCVLLVLLFTPQTASARSTFDPGVEILSVKEDLHVLIFAHDFPAFLELQVSMRPLGAPAEEAIEITTINTKESGSFFKVFYIPSALIGEPLIEINLDGIKSIYGAENIFINETFIDN